MGISARVKMMKQSMTALEILEDIAHGLGIYIDDRLLREDDAVDGLYFDVGSSRAKVIAINRHRSKACQFTTLAEELGHHFASSGDIIKQNTVTSRKQERYGRQWAIRRILSPGTLGRLAKEGIVKTYEIAEALDITEDFVLEALEYYRIRGIALEGSLRLHAKG